LAKVCALIACLPYGLRRPAGIFLLVLQGKASVKGPKREERIIEKNEIVFFDAKDYYQITNVGTEPLVLVGNRSEGFGGPHVTKEDE
jgi:hypothetical protein